MKRSPSEMALEEFLNTSPTTEHHPRIADFRLDDDANFFLNSDFPADFTFDVRARELLNGLSSACGFPENSLWSAKITPKQSNVTTTTVDSQSSICAGSPLSENKPKDNPARVITSGSDQSDYDDDEQSNNPNDVRRIRRMVSNRESARRSRRRKQAHLADLESQVDQLRGENASLFKQLSSAAQQFKDAATNNRVLKSDVEALRANVKLAEEMVARGSLTSSLNHLLQSHLSLPQTMNSHSLNRMTSVSPTITIPGDESSFTGIPSLSGQSTSLGRNSGNVNHRLMDDVLSCVTDVWPLDSHVPVVSK
ncbi:unnamed protein product [Rhodiola kirilowii]